METSPALLHNGTQLIDRVLWYDGDSTIAPQDVTSLISSGADTKHLYVDTITPEIMQFNAFVKPSDQITKKSVVSPPTFDWVLPDQYAALDVEQYVIQRCIELNSTLNEYDNTIRINRIAKEFAIYKRKNLYDMLKALIYIINTLTDDNVVWGVGRGSSVSSYVLYVIGVHDIDSVEYDLDIHDFLRK